MKEQWNELKETIIELRDNDGTATQQEVCQFLANLMNILETQIDEKAKMPKYVEVNWLLERAVPHGWSTPLWVSDIVIKDAPTVDVVEVVRCKDCKHRPYEDEDGDIYAPDWGDYTCPFLCEDSYYNGIPEDDFFCKRGEKRDDEKV